MCGCALLLPCCLLCPVCGSFDRIPGTNSFKNRHRKDISTWNVLSDSQIQNSMGCGPINKAGAAANPQAYRRAA